jgi:glycosyltransferase involved in cell wall biosynthesis
MQAWHTISVIIPTQNRYRYLELALESYVRQTFRDFEVVVVDDGSWDQTAEIVQSYQSKLTLKYIRQEQRGRAAARNRGIVAAEGRLLVFADDVRIASPQYLAAFANAFEFAAGQVLFAPQRGVLTMFDHDLSAATMPRLLNILRHRPDLGRAIAGGSNVLLTVKDMRLDFERAMSELELDDLLWSHCASLVQQFPGQFQQCRVPWLLGIAGNLAISRRALVDAGMFDEAFGGWDIDDVDLPYRLHRRGVGFAEAPGALSYRQQHRFTGWPRPDLSNLLRFAHKHDPIDAWILLRFLTKADLDQLHQIALERERGGPAARALEVEMAKLCREYVPLMTQALRLFWHPDLHAPGEPS